MSDSRVASGDADRMSVALVRAWVDILVRPRAFFRSTVVPGDQAPGLLFAMGVVFVAEGLRFVLVPDPYPVLAGQPLLSGLLFLGLAVLLVTPVTLHLVGAFQTLLLVPLARDRGGVSETVQLLAYAGAPCALAGVPLPELRALAGLYATVLLAIGLGTVHGMRFARSLLAASIPALVLYGYGFRTLDAILTLLARWYII